MLLKILSIVLMFALIVLVHEWGHYIMAKKNGVLVHEFAIGMGPKLWGIQKGETLYSIRLFPIGGFCSMEEEVGNSHNPRAMCAKKPWQKFTIVVAGAMMNFLFAWVLLSIIVGYRGYGSNIIESVEPNMPAATADFMVGDKIIAIDDNIIKDHADIIKYTKNKEKSYTFTINRDGQLSEHLLRPAKLNNTEEPRFGFYVKMQHLNLVSNISEGFYQTFQVIKQVWQGFMQMITGKVTMDQVAGIIGVVDISAKQWDTGIQSGGLPLAMMNMLFIAAILSANLGVINLLPLPALDGGRLVFIVIEMLRGKPLNAERESMVHYVGFVLLMLLTVVILYNDIMRVLTK